MNEKQKATLAKLHGWEIQNAERAYLKIGYILPDGRVIDASTGPMAEVVTLPEGAVIIGMPAS